MHTSKKFSIKEALKFGWDTTQKNIWFFLGFLLAPALITWVVSFFSGAFYEQQNLLYYPLGFLITLAGWIIGIEISFAQVKLLFKLIDKKKAVLSDLFSYFQAESLSRFFLISLLYGLMVGFGMILFIIPGIYFAITYGFAAYIYVDKKTGILESFKKSAEITRGVKWQLLWFGILMNLIIIAGATVFLVGLLIAVPTVYLAQIYIYRKLANHKHHS